MSTITHDRQSAVRRNKTLIGSVVAGLAAIALSIGVPVAANAATVVTGAQTGEWDLIAVSNTPLEVVNFDHSGAGSYKDVDAPAGWFAVGSGKVVDGDDATSITPVGGGGIRIDDAFASPTVNRTYTVQLTGVPAGTNVKITDPTNPSTVYFDTSVGDNTESFVLPAGATADFHEHFTWTFTTSASQAQIGVKVTGSGLGAGGKTNNILFTF